MSKDTASWMSGPADATNNARRAGFAISYVSSSSSSGSASASASSESSSSGDSEEEGKHDSSGAHSETDSEEEEFPVGLDQNERRSVWGRQAHVAILIVVD